MEQGQIKLSLREREPLKMMRRVEPGHLRPTYAAHPRRRSELSAPLPLRRDCNCWTSLRNSL